MSIRWMWVALLFAACGDDGAVGADAEASDAGPQMDDSGRLVDEVGRPLLYPGCITDSFGVSQPTCTDSLGRSTDVEIRCSEELMERQFLRCQDDRRPHCRECPNPDGGECYDIAEPVCEYP